MNDLSLLILTNMKKDIERIRQRDDDISFHQAQYLAEIELYLEKFDEVEA